MDLSCTVSETNCNFSRKSQFFPPHVFSAPDEEFSLELGKTVRPQETKMIDRLPGVKEF